MALVLKGKTQHISNSHLPKYEKVLLSAANVTLSRCSILNPASLLPIASDGEPHDCLSVTTQLLTPQTDLKNVPILNSDLVLFVDGSCLRNDAGQLVTGYAVCTQYAVLEAYSLPQARAAQVAELIALTRACILAKDQNATIYTDSKYAFDVVHDFGRIWKQRGFLTSSGTQISHGCYVNELLEAVQLLSANAIVKCKAHEKPSDDVTRGNDLADHSARNTALSGPQAPNSVLVCFSADQSPLASLSNLAFLQNQAPKRKRMTGCMQDVHCTPTLSVKVGMIAAIQRDWFAPNFPSMAQQYHSSCPICLAHNIGQRVKTTPAAHPPPWGPFVNLQIDFVQLPKCCSYGYILVIIDMFSGWVEAYPCIHADSIIVAKKLLKEFIPRFGLPLTIDSDRGTHFTGQILKNICQALNIQQHLHCSYHPQSSGAVECKNPDLKTCISKFALKQASNGLMHCPLLLCTLGTLSIENMA
ncbi:PREDICTED: uncharacterized protein LOC109296025 [Gavialis gangeticus]|uniref:uncharacterized protein LOC109296025 n=1 Tax=Gavialis gangeticus TaxID=94835 RepID=UPI00092FD7A9|nr:PREDICTED: uncharacterized protein LOC109296025 [Gavialis gangeticus]